MLRCKIIAYSASAFLLMFSAAEAHIVCHGNAQVVQGREILTPYCGDNTIAAAARASGMRVSDAEVRNDPTTKDDICRWLRGDSSVRSDC